MPKHFLAAYLAAASAADVLARCQRALGDSDLTLQEAPKLHTTLLFGLDPCQIPEMECEVASVFDDGYTARIDTVKRGDTAPHCLLACLEAPEADALMHRLKARFANQHGVVESHLTVGWRAADAPLSDAEVERFRAELQGVAVTFDRVCAYTTPGHQLEALWRYVE